MTYADYKRFTRDPHHDRQVEWWHNRIKKLFRTHDWEALIPIVERAEAPNPPPAIFWAVRLRGGAFTSDGVRWLARQKALGLRPYED
jgi:hypothetical protein